MKIKIEMDAEKAERLIVGAALAQCKTPLAASNEIVKLYGHEHGMDYGKHIVKPSKIERFVEMTLEKINANPYK